LPMRVTVAQNRTDFNILLKKNSSDARWNISNIKHGLKLPSCAMFVRTDGFKIKETLTLLYMKEKRIPDPWSTEQLACIKRASFSGLGLLGALLRPDPEFLREPLSLEPKPFQYNEMAPAYIYGSSSIQAGQDKASAMIAIKQNKIFSQFKR
jgi:hypothetical protein